jgi:hypothetical protein
MYPSLHIVRDWTMDDENQWHCCSERIFKRLFIEIKLIVYIHENEYHRFDTCLSWNCVCIWQRWCQKSSIEFVTWKSSRQSKQHCVETYTHRYEIVFDIKERTVKVVRERTIHKRTVADESIDCHPEAICKLFDHSHELLVESDVCRMSTVMSCHIEWIHFSSWTLRQRQREYCWCRQASRSIDKRCWSCQSRVSFIGDGQVNRICHRSIQTW